MNLKGQKICTCLHLFLILFVFVFYKKYYRRISRKRDGKNTETELEKNCELQVIMAIEETVNF